MRRLLEILGLALVDTIHGAKKVRATGIAHSDIAGVERKDRAQLAVGRLEHRAERGVAAAGDTDIVERVKRATVAALLVAKLVALALQIFDSLVAPCRLRHSCTVPGRNRDAVLTSALL